MKDKFTIKAKIEGYRARSIYKLSFINKKYNIIKKNQKILDLGCWPGSWMQYCTSQGAFVMGVDIKNINPINNTKFIHGDLKDIKTIEKIKQHRNFDVVLSDLSPNTSGKHILDHSKSIELNEIAFNISKELLKNGGAFVCKIFQGGEFNDFLNEIKLYFKFVKAIKPKVSKKKSREMYIVAIGYKS